MSAIIGAMMVNGTFRNSKVKMMRLHGNMLVFLFLISIGTFSVFSDAFSLKSSVYSVIPSCITDSKTQKMRSKELSELVSADQEERKHFDKMTRNEMNQLNRNDAIRRKRVGELMGEGCLKTSADYAAASLIYQHGDVPDHYYQAFIWANRALAFGDVKQKSLVAVTVDRYLISIGKKQLFGTQFQASDTTGWCFCLEQVEPSFPDSYRMNYLKKKLREQYKFLLILNKQKKNCLNTECPMKLSPSPGGSIPGFW